MLTSTVEWQSATAPPKEAGWYIATVNPSNHKEISTERINEWRGHFGFRVVWFNPCALPQWWIGEPTRCSPLGDRVTHWADCPPIPRV